MLFYFTFVFVSHKMSLHYCHICSLVCFSLEYNVKFPKNIHNRKRQFYLNNMYPLVFFSFTLFPPSVPLILSGPGSVCKIQAIWRNYVVCVLYIYMYIRSKRMVWKKKNTHSIGILLVYLSIYIRGRHETYTNALYFTSHAKNPPKPNHAKNHNTTQKINNQWHSYFSNHSINQDIHQLIVSLYQWHSFLFLLEVHLHCFHYLILLMYHYIHYMFFL
mmetsp:Transcript_778/g.1170  ORF Transcript_778/g.1170 Transcript_778/m.1170 type:complete len:217 (-) Transcript_778:656-1306(-)